MSDHASPWGRLYAILPATGLLCAAAHWMTPAGLWRTLAAFGVIGLTLGLCSLWLAGNRAALTRQGGPAGPSTLPRVRVLVVYLPIGSRRLAPPRHAVFGCGPRPALPVPAQLRRKIRRIRPGPALS